MQLSELIEKIKDLRAIYPDAKWFKRGEVYKLDAEKSCVLPNSVFFLKDGRILVASTTGEKHPGIFDKTGYIGSGYSTNKVKRGLLYSGDFLSYDEVVIKKLLRRIKLESVETEAKANQDIYGIGEVITTDKHTLLVMKELKGCSLYNFFKTPEAITPELRITLGIKVCEALQKFHEKDYCHSDIATRNFVYDEKNGQVCLVDFGCATRKPSNTKIFLKDIADAGHVLKYIFNVSDSDLESYHDGPTSPFIMRIIYFMVKGSTFLLPLADAIESLKQQKLVTDAAWTRLMDESKPMDKPKTLISASPISMYAPKSVPKYRKKNPTQPLVADSAVADATVSLAKLNLNK